MTTRKTKYKKKAANVEYGLRLKRKKEKYDKFSWQYKIKVLWFKFRHKVAITICPELKYWINKSMG